MAQIIRIEGDTVSIGTETGGIENVRLSDLNFTPEVGDYVDIYRTDTQIIVVKGQAPAGGYAGQQSTYAQQPNPNNGVNINITNSTAAPPYYATAGKKPVNKVAYCLLALFLGGLGVHKFYAGKIGKGVIYLIFCWAVVPEIIAFIEFIMALCQKADVNGKILV